MNTRDLFEHRATRGTPRGAAAVWRDAHGGARAVDAPRPTWPFRLALAAWVVALVVGAFAVRQPDDSPVASTATSTDDEGTPTSSEPLPAPLLIEGGTLSRERGGVSRPTDPAYDADDLFDGIVQFEPSPGAPVTTAKVYARPLDPFAGPIFVLETRSDGGFRPLGANLTPAELERYSELVERDGGSWVLRSESDLVEVANIVDDWNTRLTLGWQFGFELPGDRFATLSAEMGTPDRPISEWLMISRLAVATAETGRLTVAPTDVLGAPGVVIDTGNGSGNEVVWSDSGALYRLDSTTIVGDTAVGRDATEDVGRLRLVERAEWVEAIRMSMRESIAERLAGWAFLPTILVAVASAVWFLVRRSHLAAVIAVAVAVAVTLFWARGRSAIELAVAVAGLAIAWWRHRSRTAAHVPADARTDP
ncbi:MAG: hypothetical protein F2534_21430 [Actinobacteria bacterium]|uniref:Unannotated protein n=1 Tax=freshwater metagenome TaxID=449393 RepID=A0A6J6GBF9_9ZZZZ|nr:hypothetical protein [Actinomycetota bacterium]